LLKLDTDTTYQAEGLAQDSNPQKIACIKDTGKIGCKPVIRKPQADICEQLTDTCEQLSVARVKDTIIIDRLACLTATAGR
jgi:hypothetical protein